MEIPHVIRDFVTAVSAADGAQAETLVTDDAAFQIPGPKELPSGKAGARAFAAQHAEADGRKPGVELLDAEQNGADEQWIAPLRFFTREVASDELQFEITVGAIFTLAEDRIAALRAFPSYEEAVTAAGA
jgi:ketosteroid isomerase-like protein